VPQFLPIWSNWVIWALQQVQWARLFLVDLVISRLSYGTGKGRDLGLLMCQALQVGWVEWLKNIVRMKWEKANSLVSLDGGFSVFLFKF
jgi:hypothetical protein